ncbi:hypothetical protein [Nibribacter koreensis]|uniref:Transposase n=1 Tax=Nibribacter koreensis TaxID=1084519 RepID=A0ABP8FB82_9BACT
MKSYSTNPSFRERKTPAAALAVWYESLLTADVRNLRTILAYCVKRGLPFRRFLVEKALRKVEEREMAIRHLTAA